MQRHIRTILAATSVVALSGLSQVASAQSYPQVRYTDATPTLESVVGHDHGADVSSIPEIHEFFDALMEANPDRMEVFKYAESWQGRDLIYAAISSAENLARMEEIKADMARLASGTLSESEASSIAASIPAVVWISAGVHGDEISPPDSAAFLAYHLLAAEGDALVDQILENTIVIIDPSQNPDGRMRFHHSFDSSVGMEPFSDPAAAEHDQPWPGGRYNHYLFDLNRDWFAMTQPEVQGRVSSVLDWHPVVYVDSHEMGPSSTYYFPPPANPLNPNIPQEQVDRLYEMGRNHGRWFDRFGVAYYTREVFDAFYPGYGDMWPMLNGATAMTFEQSSARGLLQDRDDGSVITYGEGVRNNALAMISTLEVVSRDSEGYLQAYAGYRRDAIADNRGASDRYIVMDLSENTYEAESLGRRLAQQGIAVNRIGENARVCGTTYQDGALVVDLAQPQGRLARTLLVDDTPLPPDFIEETEARRARGARPELYDVTAWSLPLMFGVDSATCGSVNLSNAISVSADDPIASDVETGGSFGYAIPWTDGGQARLVIAAMREGLVGRTTDLPFVQDGVTYPIGTVVFAAQDNPRDYETTLLSLARDLGAEVDAMESSWVDDGPNFGSDNFHRLSVPRVAIAWDSGTNPISAGNTRFVIERQLGLPVTPIRTSSFARANLSAYDVVVLPTSYGLGAELGTSGANALQTYVRNGGTLIAFENSASMLTGENFGLLSTSSEGAAGASADNGAAGAGTVITSEEAYREIIADHHARPDGVPGVIARVVADTNHWLAAGYDEASALYTGSLIFSPLNEAAGENVFRFADSDTLLQSGYLWAENLEQLAYKPFVMYERTGRGSVIAFAQSPTTRAYLDGLNLVLANALVLAPAH